LRYLGSKTSLLNAIYDIVHEVCPQGILCDPFAGIATVGGFFKSKGYKVITGDILKSAYSFQVAKIQYNELPTFEAIKAKYGFDDVNFFFNSLSPSNGWFVEEYSVKRQFFTFLNAQKIQSCINIIWKSYTEELIPLSEFYFLISSLINSMDLVANTAGTYYAYLKDFTRKAKKSFFFRLLEPIYSNEQCICELCDAKDLVANYRSDILYLDPPYNERNYQRYYHLSENLASVCLPCPPPNASGVYIEKVVQSDFNYKLKAQDAFRNIVKSGQYKCLIFHYSDKGIISPEEIRNILSPQGVVDEFCFDCRAYSTNTGNKKVSHHIYRLIREK